MKQPSPLVGYNTNVRHRGRLYHIQTEDSGVQRPHITTLLFVDGGRIVASKKTSYAEHVGTAAFPGIVKQLMKEQHKAMFVALRDGLHDEPGDAPAGGDDPPRTGSPTAEEHTAAPGTVDGALEADPPNKTTARLSVTSHESGSDRPITQRVSVAGEERRPRAGADAAGSQGGRAPASVPEPHAPRAEAQSPREPTVAERAPAPSTPGRGGPGRPPGEAPETRRVREKSLDEVILDYLARELDGQEKR